MGCISKYGSFMLDHKAFLMDITWKNNHIVVLTGGALETRCVAAWIHESNKEETEN